MSLLSIQRWVKQEGELAKLEANPSTQPKLDLSFKEGQTIKISIGVSWFSPPGNAVTLKESHVKVIHVFAAEHQEEGWGWC